MAASRVSSSESRRFLFFVSSLELGGAERMAVGLARHFRESYGIYTELWGISDPGEAMRLAHRYQIPSRLIPMRWGRTQTEREEGLQLLAEEIRGFRPDAIFSYTHIANIFCALTWKQTGARSFLWYQGDSGVDRTDPTLEREAVAQTQRFVANAHHVKGFLATELGVAEDSCAIVPNAIELPEARHSRDEWRERLGVKANTFVVTALANLRIVKGHERLLRAWAQVERVLRNEGRSAQLLLAGRFDDGYDAVLAQRQALGISDSVALLGVVDDVRGLLAASDLSVLTSHTEGCPLSVMESLLVGAPFVGVAIPGIREAVSAEYEPWLVPPDDVNALTERILRVARGDGPSPALRQAEQRRITETCSWDGVGRAMMALTAPRVDPG